MMPLCDTMFALTAAFGSVALSWNIINTAGNTYVLWIAAEAAAAKAAHSGSTNTESSSVLINTVNAAFGAGSLAAPVVAELCATTLGRPLAAYWITAALTALSAVTFLLLPSPRPPGSSSSEGAQRVTAGSAGSDNASLQVPLLADGSTAAAANSDAAVEIAAAAAAVSAGSTAVQQANRQSGTLMLLLGVTAVFNLLNVGTEGE